MSDTQQPTTSAKPTDIKLNDPKPDDWYPTTYRCEGCPFRGKVIGPKGPIDSPFVIVGESPGVRELKEGVPFVGPSGVVLAAALSQHKNFPDPYITNAFKCFPGNQKDWRTLNVPTRCCSSQLKEELTAYPRTVILALGNCALWSTTGNYDLKITRERGKLFPSEYSEKGVVASTHPAFLLRGGGNFRQFKADVDYALRLLLGGVPKGVPPTTYTVVDSWAALDGFVQDYLASPHPYIAADFETTGFSFIRDRLICAGYSLNGTHSYIIPILDNPETLSFLKVIHGLKSARFIWHNGKFDIKFAHLNGIEQAFVHEDTMLQSYALDETRGIHDLETVGSDWLGSPNWKNELKKYIPKGGTYADAPRPVLYNYLAKDLYNTWAAFFIFNDILSFDPVSSKLYRETLIPASKFLANVEKNGIPVDMMRVDNNRRIYEKQEQICADELNKLSREAGHIDINPNSPKQLGILLYDVLLFKTKNRSTAEEYLKELPAHPLVMVLRKHRKIQKALSTYVTPVYENIEKDGKIHSTYLIHGTATGRLSSRNPNLQNIPRDPQIRGQFIARPGRILIEPDLNQAELRSLACMSGDKELIRIYSSASLSLHEEVRRELYGNPEDWSTSDIQKFLTQFQMAERDRYDPTTGEDRIVDEQKMRAKTVNFGIVYGREAPSIAEEFHTTNNEAQRWITAWFKRFPEAARFIQRCRMAPIVHQNLVTPFGHRKRFGVVTPETVNKIQNEASNFPHQSFASTACEHAGMRCEEYFAEEHNSHFINLVHDSLLIDAPDDDETIRVVTNHATATMQQVPVDYGMTVIPFLADAKMGYRWGSLTKQKTFWKLRAEGKFRRIEEQPITDEGLEKLTNILPLASS